MNFKPRKVEINMHLPVLIRYVFFITTFCTTASAFGHGSLIKGHVSDSLTNEMLVGATVMLNESQDVVSTDQLGNFRFDDLVAGNYQIKISFIGYKTQIIDVVIGGNEVRQLSVRMPAASLRLDEITITGNKSVEQTMTTLSKIDVNLRPVKSSQDILRMIPGVVTAQHAGGGKAEQIFLRGFDADHGTDIALTVDGMPVNMVSHAHGQGYADLHFLTPEIIDYVDFNKGPYYSKIGDFNTAGYANFHTKNALKQSSVKFEGGRFNARRTVALLDLLGSNTRNQNAYVAAEYFSTDGPFVNPQNFNRINVFGKFTGRIADDKFVSLSISTFKSEWDASGQIPGRAINTGVISRFGALDNTEGGFTGRSNVNFALTKVFDNGATLRNQVYFTNYNFELYSNFTYFLHDSINGDEIKQKENRNIYGYNLSYQRELSVGNKQVRIEAGGGLRYDNVMNDELSHIKARYKFINPVSLGDVDQVNGSAYLDASLNLTPRFIVNAGVRLDAFSFQYTNKMDSLYHRKTETAYTVSPKLNFYYNVSPAFQLYLKSGVGFHSNDTRVVVAQQARHILPKAYGTDFGAFIKPVKNMVMNIAVWQLRLQQEFVYVGDEAVVEASGKTQRYGFDISARYQAMPWLYIDFDGNYSHGRSITEAKGENYIPLAPTFTSIAGLTTTWKNGLKASLRYRLISDRPANEVNSVTAKGYFLLDGGITWTRKHVEYSVSATNLLNRNWNEAQFDTETKLKGEKSGVSELTFTPGDPVFVKGGITFFF